MFPGETEILEGIFHLSAVQLAVNPVETVLADTILMGIDDTSWKGKVYLGAPTVQEYFQQFDDQMAAFLTSSIPKVVQ
jgi:hypothetical protein